EKFLDANSDIIVTIQAYISRELSLIELLTDVGAYQSAASVGDLQHLARLSEQRRNYVESPSVISAHSLCQLLHQYLDFESLESSERFQTAKMESAEKQDHCCRVARRLMESSGPQNNQQLAEWTEAYKASLHALNRGISIYDDVVLGAVRSLFSTIPPPEKEEIPKDGPAPPNLIWWQKERNELSPRLWSLASYMWNKD